MTSRPPSPLAALRMQLLSRRGLASQNGQPLYQYRVDDEEFARIRSALKEYACRDPSLIPGYPALFVLFAAEWWRRCFAGSNWSWEPIMSELGLSSTWAPSRRSACVVTGLQGWGQRLQEGGLHYLGSIAVQGGLPTRLLDVSKTGGGWLKRLLSKVLWQSRNTLVSVNEIKTWIVALAGDLPQSYRRDEIFTLLAGVAATVLSLRHEARLTSSKEAVEHLDQVVPDWRTRFPLPMEDAAAQSLLETLIRDVADAQFERPAMILSVSRYLERDTLGNWGLYSRMELGDALPTAAMGVLFAVDQSELPDGVSECAASAGGMTRRAAVRKVAGATSAYRSYTGQFSWSGADAANVHRLTWNTADGRTWSAIAPRGEALDENMPWLFVDTDSYPTFIRQGAGRTSIASVLACVPESWTWHPVDGGQIDLLGSLVGQGRAILRCTGQARLVDADGGIFTLRTGQAESDALAFTLTGAPYWLDFLSPSAAFLGKPALNSVTPDGHMLPSALPVQWLCNGRPAETPCGPLTAIVSQHGETVLRARALLLPRSAGHVLVPRSARHGEIILKQWGASGARLLGESATLSCSSNGEDLVLVFAVPEEKTTPETVEIEALWPDNRMTARVRLPFPALGVRAFAADGSELRTRDRLCAQDLAGIRLTVVSPPNDLPIHLSLYVRDERHGRQVKLHPQPGSHQLTVRLQDYATEIAHLLSIDDETDAKVRFKLQVGDAEPFLLTIHRYGAVLNRGDDALSLGPDDAEHADGALVMAIRLQDPASEADVLPTENVSWSWRFGQQGREPGAWLVYPGKGSRLAFRPTLWPVPGKVTTDSPWARAIGHASPDMRARALDEVLAGMARDFGNPAWADVERLASHAGHLPLSNLDMWKRFARSPSAMAAMALRLGSLDEGFRFRFDQELPFAWETIPTQVWRDAIQESRRHILAMLPPDTGEAVFPVHIRSRMDELLARHNALAYQLGIASSGILLGLENELARLRQIGRVRDTLLGAAYQALITRQSAGRWPDGFDAILKRARRNPTLQPFLMDTTLRHHLGVVNLPIIVAVQTAVNQTEQWFDAPHEIHLLRTVKHFDPDWFETAYSYTLASCLFKIP